MGGYGGGNFCKSSPRAPLKTFELGARLVVLRLVAGAASRFLGYASE